MENITFPFFQHARSQPDQPALVLSGRIYSYSELLYEAKKIEAWIENIIYQTQLTSSIRVGIIASRTLEAYSGILGILGAGGHYVPIHPKNPPKRLSQILKQAKLTALIVDEQGEKCIQSLLPEELPPFLLCETGRVELHAILQAPKKVQPTDLAYLMFTSGTTGVPKGVPISYENLNHFLDVIQSLYPLTANDRVSQFFELSFDVSLVDLFLTWRSGATLYVLDEADLLNPAEFIIKNKITFWSSVPSVIQVLDRMQRLNPGAFPSLRVSFFCGEALTLQSAKAWKKAAPNSSVDNHYGPTEATVACSYYRYQEPVRITSQRQTLSIGQPYPEIKMSIVNPKYEFLPNEEVGELAISGPQIAQGYLANPELSACRFINLKKYLNYSIWYLTGDRAYQDSDGFFHILGRVDHQIKLRGYRIELEEIDFHIRSLSGSDACSIVFPNDTELNGPENDREIISFLALSAESSENHSHHLDKILKSLKEHLPVYMIPSKIVPLTALPQTTNGKVDRNHLFHLAHSMLKEKSLSIRVPPASTELRLIEIWQQLLDFSPIGIHESFGDLGGNSVKMIRMVAEIWAAFEIDIKPELLFRDPTICGMTQVIELYRKQN